MPRLPNADTTNFLLFEVSEANFSAGTSDLSASFEVGFQKLIRSVKEADARFTQTMPDFSDALQRREFLGTPYVKGYIPEDISTDEFDSEQGANRALDYFLAKVSLETQQVISDKRDIRLIQVIRMLLQEKTSGDGVGNYVLLNLISVFLETIVVNAAIFSEKIDFIHRKHTRTGMSLKVEGENIILCVRSSVLLADFEMLSVETEIEIAPSGHFRLRPLKFYVPVDLEDDLREVRDMILGMFREFGGSASEIIPLALPEGEVSQDDYPFMAAIKEKCSAVSTAVARLGREGLCAPIVVDVDQANQIKALCEAICDSAWLNHQVAKIEDFSNPTIQEAKTLLGALKQYLVQKLRLAEKGREEILNALLRCLLQRTFSDSGNSAAASNLSLPYEIGGAISNGLQAILAHRYDGDVYMQRIMHASQMYSVANTRIQLEPCADGVRILLINDIVTPKPTEDELGASAEEAESTLLGVCSQEWVLNARTFEVKPGREPLSISIKPPRSGGVAEDYDPSVLRENVLEPIKAEKRQLFGAPPSASLAQHALEVPGARPKSTGIFGWLKRNKRKAFLIGFSAVAIAASCALIATGVGSPVGLFLSAIGFKAAAAAVTATTAITYGSSVAIASAPAIAATVTAGVEHVKVRRVIEPVLESVAVHPASPAAESVVPSPIHLPSGTAGMLSGLSDGEPSRLESKPPRRNPQPWFTQTSQIGGLGESSASQLGVAVEVGGFYPGSHS